ncbi:MAG: hypothetical protein KAR05_03915 [Candidatus Omnitrophica bacterium]|nr:hypothetical protein [Candidatus Omnitrophota bacterium]
MENLDNKLGCLFKETYYFEIERKHKINTRFGIPLTILILLLGGLVYFLKNLSIFCELDVVTVLYVVFFAGALLSAGFSIYYVIRGLFWHTFDYLPKPSILDDYFVRLRKYLEKHNTDNIEKVLMERFSGLLTKYYKNCSDTNITSNDNKIGYLKKSYVALTGMICFVVLSSFPFFLKYNIEDNILKVSVLNYSKEVLQMLDEEKDKQQDQAQDQEPEEPKVRKLSEGAESKEK